MYVLDKGQPRCKLLGLVPIHHLFKRACPSLSCSFQHPENICTALYMKELCKKLFFPVQSPTVCQVAWKAEQLHKMPFLYQATFKSCCLLSVALFPLKSVGAIEQSYHDEIRPYAFEALPCYSPHLK